MKRVSRKLLVGAGVAAAAALAVVAGPSAAFAATPTATVSAAGTCTVTVVGTTANGDCTLNTLLGTFGATLNGTVGLDGSASGTLVLHAGLLGDLDGTWSGNLSGASGTITYTVQTPLGPISATVPVAVNLG